MGLLFSTHNRELLSLREIGTLDAAVGAGVVGADRGLVGA